MANIQTEQTWNIEFPIALNKKEAQYLASLVSGDLTLAIISSGGENSYSGLRGREYIRKNNIVTKHFDEKLTTNEINNLIKKGFLLKFDSNSRYQLLKPNMEVYVYIKNLNTAKEGSIFSFDTNDNKQFKVKFVKKIDSSERAKLKIKSNKLGLKATPILRKAMHLGITKDSLFELLDSNVKCYFIVDTKTDSVLQVFPKDNYVKKTPEKINFEYELLDEFISITSRENATSYIHVSRPKILSVEKTQTELKEAYKILKTHNIKVKGYSKVNDYLKNNDLKGWVAKYNSDIEQCWKQLQKESKELIKEGIYSGGFDMNPKYKQAWDTSNKLNHIQLSKELSELKRINRKISELNNIERSNNLSNYTLFSF